MFLFVRITLEARLAARYRTDSSLALRTRAHLNKRNEIEKGCVLVRLSGHQVREPGGHKSDPMQAMQHRSLLRKPDLSIQLYHSKAACHKPGERRTWLELIRGLPCLVWQIGMVHSSAVLFRIGEDISPIAFYCTQQVSANSLSRYKSLKPGVPFPAQSH